MYCRRCRHCITGDEHEHHLESKRKDVEDTGIPSSNDTHRGCIGREFPCHECAEKCQQHCENIWVGHDLFKDVDKESGDASEQRLLLRLMYSDCFAHTCALQRFT